MSRDFYSRATRALVEATRLMRILRDAEDPLGYAGGPVEADIERATALVDLALTGRLDEALQLSPTWPVRVSCCGKQMPRGDVAAHDQVRCLTLRAQKTTADPRA